MLRKLELTKQVKKSEGDTPYAGVSFHKRSWSKNKYSARYRKQHIGYYPTAYEAALARASYIESLDTVVLEATAVAEVAAVEAFSDDSYVEAEEVEAFSDDSYVEAEEVEANVVFEIEKILAKRGPKRKREYLIKWLGYNEQSWEPACNVCPQTAMEYESGIDMDVIDGFVFRCQSTRAMHVSSSTAAADPVANPAAAGQSDMGDGMNSEFGTASAAPAVRMTSLQRATSVVHAAAQVAAFDSTALHVAAPAHPRSPSAVEATPLVPTYKLHGNPPGDVVIVQAQVLGSRALTVATLQMHEAAPSSTDRLRKRPTCYAEKSRMPMPKKRPTCYAEKSRMPMPKQSPTRYVAKSGVKKRPTCYAEKRPTCYAEKRPTCYAEKS